MKPAILCALASMLVPVLAQAQVHPADTNRIATSLCSDPTVSSATINRQELAEAITFQVGILPSRLTEGTDGDLIAVLHAIDVEDHLRVANTVSDEVRLHLQFVISVFEQNLAAGNEANFEIMGTPPEGQNWLFSPDAMGWGLRCKRPLEPRNVSNSYGLQERQFLSIREKPEELAAGGETRTKSGSFAFALSRTWNKKDDGSETVDTTLAVNGTIGMRLTPARSEQTAYAFTQYNLKRVRTDPPPALPPGARRDAGDTNVIALGAMVDVFTEVSDTAFWLVGQTAYVRDFADRSSRIRFNMKADPGFSADLGLCRLGSERRLGIGVLGARCLVRADIEGGIWTDRGLSTVRSYDDYFALGGDVAYELFYHSGPRSEVLATASYRYLPVIAGDIANISRLELSLKHRFWTDRRLGIDIGASYITGTNALSLRDERNLSLGLGLVF